MTGETSMLSRRSREEAISTNGTCIRRLCSTRVKFFIFLITLTLSLCGEAVRISDCSSTALPLAPDFYTFTYTPPTLSSSSFQMPERRTA